MRVDYQMVRGDTRTIALELETADGNPIALTGDTVEFVVHDLFTVEATLDVSAGEATVQITATDTEDGGHHHHGSYQHRHAYPYNVRVTAADGTTVTPQHGLFVVLPGYVDNG